MNTKTTDIKEYEELAKLGLTPDAAPQARYADPSAITQSYYTPQTDATNYSDNRPVYSQSDAVQQAANDLAAHQQNKPGDYQSAYGDQIQGLIDKLLNREQFQYDFNADPLYQQYADKYQLQGKKAMRDTMGEAAALTGGYGNSYAQGVGQQAYQNHLQNLNDLIPGLRDAAYGMYRDEGDAMMGNLSMLQGQDAADYGKYRDTVGDYQSELAFFYNKYSDMSDAEYKRYQQDTAAWEADRAYWYQREQDKQAQANWEKEYALAQSKASSSGGGGGSSSKKTSTAAVAQVPTSYKEFCAMAGYSGILTESEFAKRKPAGYANYQSYLNAMWAKYN